MHPLSHILPAVAACAACLSCSQFDSRVPVRDLGFEVGSEIAWNADYMAYTLRLTLTGGEDGDYVLTYLVDGDPLVALASADGSSVSSGQTVTLKAKGTLILILPALVSGTGHTLDMELARNGVTRSYALTLPDTGRNGIGIRMDTDPKLDFSRVILTNLMGPSVTTYSVAFHLDGHPLGGMKFMSKAFDGPMDVDFARSESYTFELPYLVAGEHVLKVDVRSALGSESTRLSFTEPQRRQTALAFSYNEYTGHLVLESSYNPLQTAFDVTTDITVRGSVTYRHPQFFGKAAPRTETFTRTGEASARVTPGVTAESVDGGRLKALMDEVYAISRTDAANTIGNGNRRTLHTDITSVTLSVTVHSLGDYAGQTVVTVSPQGGDGLPIRYTYDEQTWLRAGGTVQTVTPGLTVNGLPPSSIREL